MENLGDCFNNRPRELALLALLAPAVPVAGAASASPVSPGAAAAGAEGASAEATEATDAGSSLPGASAGSIADHSRVLAIVSDIFPLTWHCVALARKDMWETFLTSHPLKATEICIHQFVLKDLCFLAPEVRKPMRHEILAQALRLLPAAPPWCLRESHSCAAAISALAMKLCGRKGASAEYVHTWKSLLRCPGAAFMGPVICMGVGCGWHAGGMLGACWGHDC